MIQRNALLAFLCIFATSALAVQDFTTYQRWDFSTSANPAIPETIENVNGIANIAVSVSGTVHADQPGWYDSYLGRSGVWHGDLAEMTITLPGGPAQGDYKELWVEVGFRGELLPNPAYPDFPAEIYGPKLTAWVAGVQLPAASTQLLSSTITSAGQGWRKLVIGWQINPSSEMEQVYLSFHNSGADLDNVVVNTTCIPEPATLSLLGAAGFALVVRRMKKP